MYKMKKKDNDYFCYSKSKQAQLLRGAAREDDLTTSVIVQQIPDLASVGSSLSNNLVSSEEFRNERVAKKEINRVSKASCWCFDNKSLTVRCCF
jgi:hypothetical protein